MSALLIAGRRVATDERKVIESPSTGEVVGEAPWGTVEHVNQAVEAARRALPAWRTTAWPERQASLNAVADAIEANADELAKLLTRESGKPLSGPGARFEVGGCVAWTRATASLSLASETILEDDGNHVVLHRRPIGVFGAITPWNFPLLIAIWQTVPPLLAGNTVVIKPSPFTPLASLRLFEVMAEALPPGTLNAVVGPDELGVAMSQHPMVDKIMFTGSVGTGKKVMAAASDTLKRLTLELGGNDAGIVLPDVAPDSIAEGLFWGAFINSGQTCAALKRLYVHDEIYEAVCESLVSVVKKMPMGDGLDEVNVLGPLQNAPQLEKVTRLVEDAKQRGVKVLTGGSPLEGPGYFFPATLLADADDGMPIVDEEQFGPVLPIVRVKDTADALERANRSAVGLGGSIWTKDLARGAELASRLECGTAWVNRHGDIHPLVPFGGIKGSGFGSEFGFEGLKQCTQVQVISVNREKVDATSHAA